MTIEDKGRLLMICGAISDVAEKSKVDSTKLQLAALVDLFEKTLKRDWEIKQWIQSPNATL